ncbi:hypothetical protein [Okeania sp. SIO1I7]|uniref:hypothetical protein n=1 Tax=Okeania sp. SIO1I7 TaxID=2607772 RepID=UPI0013F79E35|nr:hypothetical protein [Okeania sp. SIO1I7]NET29225.1 hypothetical protein [Okeania sp. SIO1I7]
MSYKPTFCTTKCSIEEGVRSQETGDRILEENHSYRDRVINRASIYTYEGWRGDLAISNGPRENQVQYFKPLTFLRNAAQTGRGTDN